MGRKGGPATIEDEAGVAKLDLSRISSSTSPRGESVFVKVLF
jgi:hypothetical protein